MNTFIRLSDELEMTEQDIDPLCTIPSRNFQPSSDLYAMVRKWAKPSFDPATQKVVKAPTALVDGIWTQQWSIVELSSEEIAANTPTPAERRAAMPPISPLQGILTLGETRWNAVLAYRDRVYKNDPDPDNKDGDPMTPWAERVIISNADNWVRTSQNVDFIGYLLGYGDEEMDTLFIAAAQVTA